MSTTLQTLLRRHRLAALCITLLVAGSCGGDGGSTDPDPDPDPEPDRSLTVTVEGFGAGRVTSQPAGIDCSRDGGTCQATFAHGTQVTLSAAPEAGMTFDGWSGACSGAGLCALSMTQDRAVEAGFDDPDLVAEEIGPAGGEITSVDGRLTLTVPPAALAATTTLTIARLDAAELSQDFQDLGVGAAWELGPDGLEFDAPVVAAYRDDAAPTNQAGDIQVTLRDLWTDVDGEPVPLDSLRAVVDVDEGTLVVSGELDHFTPLVYRDRSGQVVLTVSGVPFEVEAGQPFTVRFFLEETDDDASRDRIVSARGSDFSFNLIPDEEDFDLDVDAQAGFAERNVAYRCDNPLTTTIFDVLVSTTFHPWTGGEAGEPHRYTLIPERRLTCATPISDVLPRGSWTAGTVTQPFGISWIPSSLEDVDLTAPPLGWIELSGEGNGQVGLFTLIDPISRVILLERATAFYIWSVVTALRPGGAAAFLAWGADGWGLFTRNTPFGETPTEEQLDERIDDAVPIGGGAVGEGLVFASRQVGIRFVLWDETLGRYAVSDEVLEDGLFAGDPISAYAATPDGPALVVARGSQSRLYRHPRNGGAPQVVADGFGASIGVIRCLEPLCILFPEVGATSVPVFLFDGQAAPTRVADAQVGFRPNHGVLARLPDGNVAAVLLADAGSQSRIVEAELDVNGALLRTFDVPIPTECDGGIGRTAYVPDDDGAAIVVSCYADGRWFAERSQLFEPPAAGGAR